MNISIRANKKGLIEKYINMTQSERENKPG